MLLDSVSCYVQNKMTFGMKQFLQVTEILLRRVAIINISSDEK